MATNQNGRSLHSPLSFPILIPFFHGDDDLKRESVRASFSSASTANGGADRRWLLLSLSCFLVVAVLSFSLSPIASPLCRVIGAVLLTRVHDLVAPKERAGGGGEKGTHSLVRASESLRSSVRRSLVPSRPFLIRFRRSLSGVAQVTIASQKRNFVLYSLINGA